MSLLSLWDWQSWCMVWVGIFLLWIWAPVEVAPGTSYKFYGNHWHGTHIQYICFWVDNDGFKILFIAFGFGVA